MISYLEGRLLRKDEDRVVVLAGGVGYEVFVAPTSRAAVLKLQAGHDGDAIQLYISYHHSAHQTRPVLIGFESELEREFFEKLISVEDMGPTAAARAMTEPVATIARAIETRNVKLLTSLGGIGPRKAEKIIAALNGKVAKFALMAPVEITPTVGPEKDAIIKEVYGALVDSLGYRIPEAKKVLEEALKRKPDVSTAEELFEVIFRGQRG